MHGSSSTRGWLVRRRRLWPVALAVGVASLTVWLAKRLRSPDSDTLREQVMAPLLRARERRFEARLTEKAADRHRAYESSPSHDERLPVLPMISLSRLERAGDHHVVATALLLAGEVPQARARFERLATELERRARAGEGVGSVRSNADVLNDLAVTDQLAGQVPEALRLLDGILAGIIHQRGAAVETPRTGCLAPIVPVPVPVPVPGPVPRTRNLRRRWPKTGNGPFRSREAGRVPGGNRVRRQGGRHRGAAAAWSSLPGGPTAARGDLGAAQRGRGGRGIQQEGQGALLPNGTAVGDGVRCTTGCLPQGEAQRRSYVGGRTRFLLRIVSMLTKMAKLLGEQEEPSR